MVTVKILRTYCTKQNDRPKVTYFTCGYTAECPLHAKGKCACGDDILSYLHCPNANFYSDVGPTKRAKSFDKWVEDKKAIKSSAETAEKRLSKVYGFYYLPYAFLTGARNDLEGIQNHHFVSEDDFDVDYIEKVVRFRPEAWFGGIIKKYSEKEVPKFITHLQEDFPELYKEWSEKYPESAKMVSEISPVGRKVFIRSLPDGTEIRDNHGTFVKEGNFLKCDEWKSAFIPFSAKKGRLTIEITEDMTVTVGKGMELGDNPKFAD